jgi:hypothetical protein
MLFTGDSGDRCPISFARARNIKNPVGFNSNHAFECNMLVYWLTQRSPINPITAVTVCGKISDILHPLIVKGDHAHVNTTQRMLDVAGYALGEPAPSDDDLLFQKFAMMSLGMALLCFWTGFLGVGLYDWCVSAKYM